MNLSDTVEEPDWHAKKRTALSGRLGKCVLKWEELRTLKCVSGRIEEGSWRQPGWLPFLQDEGSGVICETGKKGQPLS